MAHAGDIICAPLLLLLRILRGGLRDVSRSPVVIRLLRGDHWVVLQVFGGQRSTNGRRSAQTRQALAVRVF